MKTPLVALTLSALTLASSTIQAAAPGTAEPPTVATTPVAPKPGSDDPNIDRGFLLPTAMTQPGGSATYNNYELLLHGFTYAPTDRIQTTITVLSPIVKDMPFFGVAAVKGRLNPMPRLHLALQGSLGYTHAFSQGAGLDSAGMFGGGGFGSVCLRQDCSSLVSASVTYQLVVPNGSASNGQMVIYGASIVHAVSRHVKLLGELASIAATAGSNDWENVDGALASYGLRFHSADIAGDVGFVRPIGEDTGPFIMGLPFVNISYRWQ